MEEGPQNRKLENSLRACSLACWKKGKKEKRKKGKKEEKKNELEGGKKEY